MNGCAWAPEQVDETQDSVELACADVFAHAVVRASASHFPALRRKPDPEQADPLPASLLKHADEQTVAALAAILKASRQAGRAGDSYGDWGLVAAPRFIGRAALATFVERFQLEGAWGASPHIVPHHALHSASGTISQVLGLHGPNFGVGGGPGEEAEAWLACLTMLAGGQVPGVWLAATRWMPEMAPPRGKESAAVEASSPCICEALAVALVPSSCERCRPRVRLLQNSASPPNGASQFGEVANGVSLATVNDRLEARPDNRRPPLVLGAPCGGLRIVLETPEQDLAAEGLRTRRPQQLARTSSFAHQLGACTGTESAL